MYKLWMVRMLPEMAPKAPLTQKCFREIVVGPLPIGLMRCVASPKYGNI